MPRVHFTRLWCLRRSAFRRTAAALRTKTWSETRQQIEGSIPNLAIEGIFTFLFAPKSIRWGINRDRFISKPNQTPSSDVKRFCILRSLNSLFWERSYEFVRSLAEEKTLKFVEDYPPWTILQGTRVGILQFWDLKDSGRLDLSSLLSLKDLELRNINGLFSLSAPPNLESLNIYSNIDMVDLVQDLKETKIIKLEICAVKHIGRLDLSSLLTVKDLELGVIYTRFSLTPPPNLERFNIYDSNIDMVDLIQGLKETKIIKLEIWRLKDIGRLDLSSLLTVKDLELVDIKGCFSLTPPPNLKKLYIDDSDIDMDDLVQGLKETKIIKLDITDVIFWGTLDLSSLLSVKDLELSPTHRYNYSLTPPPNVKRFKFYNEDVDMVGFDHSDIIHGC